MDKLLCQTIADANLTPEILVKTYQRMTQILDKDNLCAFTVEVGFEGKEYDVTLDMSLVKITDTKVDEDVYDQIRKTKLNSAYFIRVVKILLKQLEENGQYMYKLPISLGFQPVEKGAVPVMDLRIKEKDEEK